MKNIVLIIAFALSHTFAFSQQLVISHTGSSSCEFNLAVDGTPLTKISDCDYEAQQVVGGTTYQLEASPDGSNNLAGISTLDLIWIQRGLLFNFDNYSPLQIYKSDVDQDGAVSTYDIVSMRALILGITTDIPGYHILGPGSVIPDDLDPYDFQVDFSTLNFDVEDFNASGQLEIDVIKIGDID